MNDLKDAIKKGTKAWADVPADWVEELRGNDTPPVKSYAGGKPNYCTPKIGPEVPCKTHPDAPHGFDRNASHSADRYVCECESWEPVDAVNMSQDRVDVPGFDEPMWLVDEKGNKQLLPKANRAAPKREWVGLTDEDLSVCDEDGVLLARYWETKLKEKNT